MLSILRLVTRLIETLVAVPIAALRFLGDRLIFNPRLGPLRYLATAAVGYVLFAFALVYVVAPLFAATSAITSWPISCATTPSAGSPPPSTTPSGNFVGTFDPRLDSQRDVNYTDAAIELGDYVANPDHKSIPVREVPEHYWQCLVYHEDRHLGGCAQSRSASTSSAC